MVLDKLQWRYAVKAFDPNQHVSDDKINILVEALRHAPSSFGLQPWRFIVIRDTQLQQTLYTHSYNQSQIKDASYLIVLCRKRVVSETMVSRYIHALAYSQGVAVATLSGYASTIQRFLSQMSIEQQQHWMENQVYIALGVLLTACAVEGIDACPMEGIQRKSYDYCLQLESEGHTTVIACPIGYRSETDTYAHHPKVRYSKDDILDWRITNE